MAGIPRLAIVHLASSRPNPPRQQGQFTRSRIRQNSDVQCCPVFHPPDVRRIRLRSFSSPIHLNPPREQGHYIIPRSLTNVSGYDWRWPESHAWPSFNWPPLVTTRRVSKVNSPVAASARIRSSRCDQRTPQAVFAMACNLLLPTGGWQGFRSPSSIAETTDPTPGFVRIRGRTALSG
ncbi:hypothetical protein RB11765 [Rhodopirellula baltica SH 1]|uniref:Uncharacterized protein n=1 Tax=Rhodopirellula baltica (strain DSM 10527 / NCIMB 13988 / SH1) TaxID=243090 RepID=Q7UDV2_RHOBA|nr:hypothetical protein RB11765 [Rhodopirellula baltica SH 1]